MKTRTKLILACALLALLISSGMVMAATDVNVTSDPNVQNEISLTLIPGQPNKLVMAYNDNPVSGAPFGLGIAYSQDRGSSWNTTQLTFPNAPTGNTMTREFDPTITADANGNVFAGFIADGANSLPGGWPDSGLYVCKSTDGGMNWAAPNQVSYDPPSAVNIAPDPNYRFNDRCQITADTFTGSPHAGNIYISWIKDRGWYANDGINRPLGDIYFSRSTNAGQTFSAPMIINDQVNHDMGNMPIPVVASDGTVYVTWMDYNVWGDPPPTTPTTGDIYIRKSINGGQNFPAWGGGDHFVITINLAGGANVPPFFVTGVIPSADTLAKGAPVPATSPNDPNELYIVYAADPDGAGTDEADIFFIKSTDKGQNWSSPMRVNDDKTKNDQILPWIDVKPDGKIDVAWYDRRSDIVFDTLWDVYIAKSVDGGTSFSTNLCLTDQSFAAPTVAGGWIGEYLGLAVDANDAYVAFTSSITDATGGDIYFDRIPNVNIVQRGDFEPDDDVDFYDFAALAAAWRSTPSDVNNWNPVCDISDPNDNVINYKDVNVFTNYWMYGR